MTLSYAGPHTMGQTTTSDIALRKYENANGHET